MALSREQRSVARTLIREGRRAGASRKQILAAIETGLVESNLTNIRGGDRDSSGWRQERASSYPGKNRNDVAAGAQRFYAETRGKGGGTAGQLAQSAQRSAFPGRYDQRRGQAKAIIRSLGNSNADEGENAIPSTTQRIPGYDHLYKPGVDNSSARRELLRNYLAEDYKPDALLSLATGLKSAQDTAATVKKVRTGDAQTVGGGGREGGGVSGASGTFKITGPNPGRLNKGIVRFAKQVAGQYGGTVTGSDGTGHSRNTVSGNLSQHTTGDATDIPASGKELRRLGRAALIAAGMPKSKARKQMGGLYNVGGKQIIFATNQGGNHHDHLHIGS